MDYGRKLFTRLRGILRIYSESVPLSSVLETESDEIVCKMEQELEAFKNELYKNLLNDKSQVREKKIIFDHLERYKDKLFLTNFQVDTNDTSKDIIMERTNNIEEQQFRKFKRNQRRIHGNRDVGHDLNFYGSYLPIVWNLNHDDSELFKIIGLGMDNLESQSNGLLTP